jgi:hypothetical protein
VISNSTINGNSADEEGGGIHNSYSKVTITNTKIRGNKAVNGGGINNSQGSALDMVNVLLSGNYGHYGGGLHNSGGDGGDSKAVLINVTVSGNKGDLYGGGIHNDNGNYMTLKNCIVAGNQSNDDGAGHNFNGHNYGDGSRQTISSSLIGNSQSASNYPSTTLSANQIFADWKDPSGGGWQETVAGDYQLKLTCDDAIDTGDNSVYPSSAPNVDLAGVSRKLGQIDMGAYEAAAPGHSVSISTTTLPTYGQLVYGYDVAAAAGEATGFSVANTGTRSTGPLTLTLAGANPGSFTLSPSTLSSISVGGTPATFTVTPVLNLNAGVYTATVTVTGGNGIVATYDVTQTVSKTLGVAVSGAPTLQSKTDVSLTVNPVTIPANPGNQTVEYAVSTSSITPPAAGWQDGTAFVNLQPNATYYVFARSKENGNYFAGAGVTMSAAIKLGDNIGGTVVLPPVCSPAQKDNGDGTVTLLCESVILLSDGTQVTVPAQTVVTKSSGLVTFPWYAGGKAVYPCGTVVELSGGTTILGDIITAGEYGATITWADGTQNGVLEGTDIIPVPAITGCLRVVAPPTPSPGIPRQVLLVLGNKDIVTTPPAGIHWIYSGSNFKLTLTPPAGRVPIAQTDRLTADGQTEILTGSAKGDGSYTITVPTVTQSITVTVKLTGEEASAVQEISTSQVWSHGGKLYVRTDKATSLYIYTPAGQLFRQYSLDAGETVIELPAGFYVVSMDGKRWKTGI